MRVCQSCGMENRVGARFCDACGATLGAAAEQASPVRKTVTILFADVSGSTGLGERLDPEALRALMARFFSIARRVVEKHGGTVEKYIGDAVMAVFGIPTVHEEDALRAVRAASELGQGVRDLAGELRRDHGVDLAIRTGVDTGPVVVGDPSTGGTLATGDAVNVAARLQQAAAPGEILVGGATLRLVRDSVEVEPLGAVTLRGHAEPVAAFRLLAVDRAAPASARRLDVPMVGREREMALLARAFDDVVADRRIHLFTLLGPPGVGKSRLVRQVLSSSAVDSTGARILRGRSLSYGEGLTYWALREAIAAAAGILDDDPVEVARDRLRALLAGSPGSSGIEPRLAEFLGLEAAISPVEELTWAIRSLLESMAETAPVILVLDDLQWADPPLLDLIEHVVDFGRDVPILVLCLARPDLLDARPGWGGGKLNATTLLLEPLPTADAVELAGHLLGGGLPDAVAARIARAAEGNPLFVEEFAGMLADDGLLEREAGRWVAQADLTTISVPPTIQALLAARLDRLPPGERAVAGRASIVGRLFEAGAVVALSPEPERDTIPDRLGGLVRKEVVRPDRPGLDGQLAYRFRHLLIRDAAYEGLSKLDRATLHERFADWLIDVTGERAGDHEEILGYHLEQAYRYRVELGPVDDRARALARRAASHLSAAGRRAAIRREGGAARDLLRPALELARVGSPEDTVRLATDLADAEVACGEWQRARLTLDQLPPGALDDPLTAARVRFLTLTAQINMDPSVPFETIDRGLAELAATFEQLGDELDRVKVLGMRGFTLFARGHAAEAVDLVDTAVAIARRTGSALWIEAASWIPLFDAFGPRPASTVVDRALELLETAAGHPGLEAIVSLGLGAGRVATGEAVRGLDDLADAADRLGRLGLPLWRGGALQLLGYLRLSTGDHEGAEQALRAADDLLATMGETGYRSTVDAILAKVLIEAGRPEEAAPWIELGRSLAAPDDVLTQTLWRSAAARLASWSGDHAAALSLGREAVAITGATDYLGITADVLLDLARVQRSAGLLDAAEGSARSALDLYLRKEDRFGQRRAQAALAATG